MDLDNFLTDAAKRAPGNEVSITIRDFISHWGAQRRGLAYVTEINKDLEAKGLRSTPSFEEGWIDNTIRLVPLSQYPDNIEEIALMEVDVSPDQVTTSGRNVAGLKIGNLQSASAGVYGISRADHLGLAQAIMLKNNYSQVPVLGAGGDLQGAVSWESIAQTSMYSTAVKLMDCIVAADSVSPGDDLLLHVPRIMENGCVFVRASDQQVVGIVTTADLSGEFLSLAGPFLLIGEVEREIRRIVDKVFTPEQISTAARPVGNRPPPSSADELSFGDYVSLFESKKNWNNLNWPTDRTVFTETLHSVRQLRNEIMHFSPDPIESPRLVEVRNILKWLRLIR